MKTKCKAHVNHLALGALVVSLSSVLSGCNALSNAVMREMVKAQGGGNAASPNAASPLATKVTLAPLTAQELSDIKAAQYEAAQWADQALKSTIKPISGNRGIVIFEPVVSGVSSTTAETSQWQNLATGCALWVHLNVGGQPALGSTPLWGAVADGQRELNYTNLQLSPKDAVLFSKHVQATHMATGTFLVQGTTATLTYQVFDVATSRPVGAPVSISGNREQLVASLPKLSVQLAKRLVTRDIKPTAINLRADELAFLGTVPRKSEYGKVTHPQELRLRQIAQRDALAGLLWIYNGPRNEKRFWSDVTGNLKKHAGQNALVWATLGWKAPAWIDVTDTGFTSLMQSYPNNAVLALGESNWRGYNNDMNGRTKAIYRAIAASPRSDVPWLRLADMYSDQAQDIRRSRFYNDMSSVEKSQLSQLYPQWYAAALNATRLNPKSSFNWKNACTAAVFNSESLAPTFLWQALRTDPDNSDAYSWGLQMFQPKWGADIDSLRQTVALASQRPQVLPWLLEDIEQAYRHSGISAEYTPIPGRALKLAQKLVAAEPQNSFNRSKLGHLLKDAGRLQEALQQFQRCEQLWPDSSSYTLEVAKIYADHLKDQAKANKYFQKAIAVDPTDGWTVKSVAEHYKEVRDYEHGAPLFRRAIQLNPNDIDCVLGLANLEWHLKNDKKTGDRLFKKAISMKGGNGYANAEYAWALMRHGKHDEAVSQAQKALQLGYYSHPVFKELGLRN